jgi:transposase-like protein
MSSTIKEHIIILLQNRKSIQQVADLLHVSYSMVQRVYKTISPSLPRKFGRCSAALKAHDQHLIAQKVTSGAALNSRDFWT